MNKSFCVLIVFIIIAFPLIAAWSDDPGINSDVCIETGEQTIPKVATGSTGDSYISYFSNEDGNYDLCLQRYDELR